MKQASAKLRYLKMTPRKVRLIADVIKNKSVNDAEEELMFQSRRAAEPILKLLRSAISNAKEMKLDVDRLIIRSIEVNQGPMLKRFLPRARGSASPIERKMSHVSLILEESDKVKSKKFSIVIKKKDRKDEHSHGGRKHAPQVKEGEKEKVAPKQDRSFMRRFFRRKAV